MDRDGLIKELRAIDVGGGITLHHALSAWFEPMESFVTEAESQLAEKSADLALEKIADRAISSCR